ncbi:MAG TPA: short-chain dehydrogenase [Candidatus Margulisbacteria bacterium]|nr:short-chain dehydrogenase [Candidatus Margulisiibacteriota bacterium]
MRLKNKLALITGASRGIGKAIALELASEGAAVIITYKDNKDLAQQLVTEIIDRGQSAYSFQLDVCSRTGIKDLAKTVTEKHDAIDILVNNAGINIPNDFSKITDEDWDSVLNTNLSSVFKVGQEFERIIKDGGAIVNISSVSGQYGGPRSSHYAASKAGLISLTQNMAIFFSKRSIRVNAVSPGLIESEMASAANKLGLDEKILLGRRGTVQEVAKAVCFLVSEEASYVTAQVLNVNGGLYF